MKLAVLTLAVACSSAPARSAAPRCTGGEFSDPDRLATLTGCTEIRGDLSISGAAVIDLEPLGSVRAIGGNLTVGPTSRLVNARGLAALATVGGDLTVAHNFELGGLFLGALARVDGAVIVERNLGIVSVSMHRLRSIGGGARFAGNRSLERLDLSALASVEGDLAIDGGSGGGDLVLALPNVVAVSGKRHIDVGK